MLHMCYRAATAAATGAVILCAVVAAAEKTRAIWVYSGLNINSRLFAP